MKHSFRSKYFISSYIIPFWFAGWAGGWIKIHLALAEFLFPELSMNQEISYLFKPIIVLYIIIFLKRLPPYKELPAEST